MTAAFCIISSKVCLRSPPFATIGETSIVRNGQLSWSSNEKIVKVLITTRTSWAEWDIYFDQLKKCTCISRTSRRPETQKSAPPPVEADDGVP